MATRSRVLFYPSISALACAVAGWAGTAEAAFVTPSGWTRPTNDTIAGSTLTTYQEWNFLTAPAGPNDPDIGEVNPNPGIGPNTSKANAYDTSGLSFVTSGGNIYSFSGPTQMKADVPSYNLGSSASTTVLFQVRTLGTELDYDGVQLTYNNGSSDQTLLPAQETELDRVSLGGFGGFQVDTLFRFEIPFSPNTFRIVFPASGSSMSADMVAVDTLTSVPEPAGIGMVVSGGLALLARRRRTNVAV